MMNLNSTITIIRAKLFGVLTVNALEGIINEIDQMIPPEAFDGALSCCAIIA